MAASPRVPGTTAHSALGSFLEFTQANWGKTEAGIADTDTTANIAAQRFRNEVF
jgi:hypothetical protein